MKTETLDYFDHETQLEAFLAWDDSKPGRKPAVLVAHDWTGRREFAENKAKEMAKLGYVGFALDMYGKGVFGADGDVEGNSALMNPLAGDRAALRQRVLSALDVLKKHEQVDSSRVGAMGYCFGGMCVLELARSGADVKGVISIHGIFSPGDVPNEKIISKILCLHGQDDPMVPPQQVLDLQNELSDAGADWQVHAYGGTMHAFTNPSANNPDFGTVYNPLADRRATKSIEDFFEEVFV